MTRWRRSGGVAAQASCAFLAICTAASISASEAKATLAVTSPVAGIGDVAGAAALARRALVVDVMADIGQPSHPPAKRFGAF